MQDKTTQDNFDFHIRRGVTFTQPAGSPGTILPISSLRALINGSRWD